MPNETPECPKCGWIFAIGEELDCPRCPDLALLAKFESGEGGSRTGVLKRLGLLGWYVTNAGRELLREAGFNVADIGKDE